jgi:hypothetical protein
MRCSVHFLILMVALADASADQFKKAVCYGAGSIGPFFDLPTTAPQVSQTVTLPQLA